MANIHNKLKDTLGSTFAETIKSLPEPVATQLYQMVQRPDLRFRVNRRQVPVGLTIQTAYGSVNLQGDLQTVGDLYINGVQFYPHDNSLDGLGVLLSNDPSANVRPSAQLLKRPGSTPTARRNRTGATRRGHRRQDEVSFEALQDQAFADLSRVPMDYATFYQEFGDILGGNGFSLEDLVSEMIQQKVDPKDMPHFLAYESEYKENIIAALYGLQQAEKQVTYNFQTVSMTDDSFIGQLVARLGVDSAEYDPEAGVLQIGDRKITNLPRVDERGIFHSGKSSYIPYHIGYFEDGVRSRVERLRHIDPVASALDAVVLQYNLTGGDIRFKALMDVTRNLPDFDNHPFGEEILDTFKRKVVFSKSYADTNSLLAEHHGNADELGAVALTMLDDDAEGLIDPYGTSNGSNMGMIFYITQDAQFNADGTFTKGTEKHTLVGDIMNQFCVDKDNFNRNQMSFNALLTSTDAQLLNVCYAEFGLFNSEDAVVITDSGAARFQAGVKTGDKVLEMHGNKSVSSLLIDRNMSLEEAREQGIEHAVAFAKLNPDVDMIVSPISLASRLNMGVAHEALQGDKKDLVLLDGTVVKDGIAQILYMTLPQTAEHKSKDYSEESGQGRRYSKLFQYAMQSKVGEEMYRKALVSDEVRQSHIDTIVTAFGRLGVSFDDEQALIKKGNINFYTDAPITVDLSDFRFKSPALVRLTLEELIAQGDGRGVNILLGEGDNHVIYSTFSNSPITDSQGRNVLPIRVEPGQGIPYRFTNLMRDLSTGNRDALQRSYTEAVYVDYSALTRKDNLLKNIDTMTFYAGAKTEMIAPDPRLRLGEVRSSIDDDRVIGHRDPCIKAGNTISFTNVGKGVDNLTHINPLIVPMLDADFDSDTMGFVAYYNTNLTEEEKAEFFTKSNVYEQLNRYGEVFLATGGSHFKAAVLANHLDDSVITFEDGKSNQELADIVEGMTKVIVDSPNSYGAYALSFENEWALKDTLGRLADDGIKGDRETMNRHFDHGYTPEENRALMKALIAKSEWTGLAGAVTNYIIAGLGDDGFDPDITRAAFDVTYTMTQSVLQMKKNADKLNYIDNCITQMKQVMGGKYGVEESREILLKITDGLTPPACINHFVDLVAERGEDQTRFGAGIFNNTDMSTAKLAYTSANTFNQTLINAERGGRPKFDALANTPGGIADLPPEAFTGMDDLMQDDRALYMQ